MTSPATAKLAAVSSRQSHPHLARAGAPRSGHWPCWPAAVAYCARRSTRAGTRRTAPSPIGTGPIPQYSSCHFLMYPRNHHADGAIRSRTAYCRGCRRANYVNISLINETSTATPPISRPANSQEPSYRCAIDASTVTVLGAGSRLARTGSGSLCWCFLSAGSGCRPLCWPHSVRTSALIVMTGPGTSGTGLKQALYRLLLLRADGHLPHCALHVAIPIPYLTDQHNVVLTVFYG